ncbi:hypothetical protein [Rhodoferax sp. GW822-FHT02A01]|uniref:hypothetical protein n=1 Tax=Rhodoferax sp. GW822-FHT02A01 TaxID=3141537 RepID=UPI00315C793D
MKIIHSISLFSDEAKQTAFLAAGIALKTGFTSFKIAEDDIRWSKVSELALQFEAVDMATTKFSERELRLAEYFGVVPTWHYGYPEPSDDFGYLSNTYDPKSFCERCKNRKVQIELFRIKKAPTWGSKSILQLHWVYDEYFVRPDLWRDVFQPLDVGCKPVVLVDTGAVVDSVVQLDIPHLVELDMDERWGKTRCDVCGSEKYLPITRGPYPLPATKVDYPIFKSKQYFGSGGKSFRMVVASAALRRALQAVGAKGVDFKPCIG